MSVAYRVGRSIYVALTNRGNTVSRMHARGPGFVMPSKSNFAPLAAGHEPTAAEVAAAVNAEAVDGCPVESAVFSGVGEPLLRLRVLEEVASGLLTERAWPLRVNTNGLMPASEAAGVALRLSKAGISTVSVNIATHDPKQYDALMEPEPLRYSPAFSLPLGHAEVCSFVEACVVQGLQVECTAVTRPEVDVEATSRFVAGLGAIFREQSWHPV